MGGISWVMRQSSRSHKNLLTVGHEDSMAATVTEPSSVAASGQLGMAAARQPRMIDPQELTLGALIGEGGFGKVPTEAYPHASWFCCTSLIADARMCVWCVYGMADWGLIAGAVPRH